MTWQPANISPECDRTADGWSGAGFDAPANQPSCRLRIDLRTSDRRKRKTKPHFPSQTSGATAFASGTLANSHCTDAAQ